MDDGDGADKEVAAVRSELSRWLALPIALELSERSTIEDMIQ